MVWLPYLASLPQADRRALPLQPLRPATRAWAGRQGAPWAVAAEAATRAGLGRRGPAVEVEVGARSRAGPGRRGVPGAEEVEEEEEEEEEEA